MRPFPLNPRLRLTDLSRSLDRQDGTYNITFIHVNDVHAHLDTFRHTGVDCPEDNVANNISCYGGASRSAALRALVIMD